MLLQEGMSKLKIINKRLNTLQDDIYKYSAWVDKTNHPLGKVGVNEFNKKEAEKKLKSKIQSYRDLMDRYLALKIAIKRTNLDTKISVGDDTFTIAEAIVIKHELLSYQSRLVNSIDNSVKNAERAVERFNMNLPNDASREQFAQVWYLVDPSEVDDIRKFIDEFVEEIDMALQIANATTDIIGLDD